jgi:hypothetical protein
MERFRSTIFGLNPEVHTDAATLGTVCHAVAEDALLARQAGRDESLEGMLSAFDYYWDEHAPLITKWGIYNPDKVVGYGYSRLQSWHEQIYLGSKFDPPKPVGVEAGFDKLFIEDNERVVNLRGTIDLVEEDCVWDWKFPSRDYAKSRWQYERWDVQSIAYCWAMGIPNFRYGIIHPTGVSYIELERDQSHTDWLRQKVLALCQYVENSQSGPWLLGDNGWWCSEKWCSNWARCKGATEEVVNGIQANGSK